MPTPGPGQALQPVSPLGPLGHDTQAIFLTADALLLRWPGLFPVFVVGVAIHAEVVHDNSGEGREGREGQAGWGVKEPNLSMLMMLLVSNDHKPATYETPPYGPKYVISSPTEKRKKHGFLGGCLVSRGDRIHHYQGDVQSIYIHFSNGY